jgi:rod shape-determining protein MreC
MAAAEAQHAADLSAERLPGIHDDANPAAAAGANGAAPATTPIAPVGAHPLPALHPDRFSSGSTPPASAMTPGAASSAPGSQGAPSSPQARPSQPEATK